MEEENKKKKKKNSLLTSLIVGGAVGSILGLLFAPKKGEELREDIKNTASELVNKSKDTKEMIHNVVDKPKEVISGMRDTVNKAPKSVLLNLIEWLEEDEK